ncbi:MAG: intracellular multiplication protein IcmK, partial [Acetobacteraceae bacterium]|nr:intracellular multiplication protein IcmK [Acetobacteraceae bacterium]
MRIAPYVMACMAGFAWAAPGSSQTTGQPNAPPDAPPAADTPAAKAARDAIPLTPDMIEDLARRYRAQQQTIEQGMTELAAPINRQVNVSFAPGSATSIINTVKGYPT